MTSAADIISKPAARPEPAAPKAASPKDDGVSFADVLETETAAPEAEAPEADEDIVVTADAAPVATQPAPQPATPAIHSPEAILAGLTLAAPAPEAVTDGASQEPNIDTVTPVVAQPAASANAAAATATIAPPPAATVQAAAATAPAAKSSQPVATNAAATQPQPVAAASAAEPSQPDATGSENSTDGADATTEASGVAANTDLAAASAAALSSATLSVAAIVPAVTPAATPAPEAASLSAPGAERVAATPIEGATTSGDKSAAATDATKAQASIKKPTQTAVTATDAAPEAKADAAPAPAASTPVDTLASTRTPAAEATRAAQSPALANAPPTTVQVYQRMVERFDGRAQRYEIRLDPAELGRVDVRIEVGADKKVHAVLAAHDSAALSDLMRGQRSLERALADAGIDVADGGIKFELSNDQGRNSANSQNSDDGNASVNVWRGFNTVDVAVDAQTAAAARPWRPSSRLDLVA